MAKVTRTQFFLSLLLVMLYQINEVNAQCPIGETEITIEFSYTTYYERSPLIQWDYIAGGVRSGNGPYDENDVITACVTEGDLIIVGCDEQYGYGWAVVDFSIEVTEDGSINGCGAQNGCTMYIGDTSNIPYIKVPCNNEQVGPNEVVAQLIVGSCNSSAVLTTGCTNPLSANYNACATIDDGSCMLSSSNDKCGNALPISIGPKGSCPNNAIQANNTGNTIDYSPSCGNPGPDLFYSFIVPDNGSIQIFSSPIEGTVNATVLDVCDGTEYFCGLIVLNEKIANLPAGEELILHIWQNDPRNLEFCIQQTPPPPSNDFCENAIPICGITNGTNFAATIDTEDPITSCIGSLDNTVWFSFQADGSGESIVIDITQGFCSEYYPYDFDALQTNLLSGPCGGPYVEEDCISANIFTSGPSYTLSLLNPVEEVSYFVYIDGTNGIECDFTIQASGGILDSANCDESFNTPTTGSFNCE